MAWAATSSASCPDSSGASSPISSCGDVDRRPHDLGLGRPQHLEAPLLVGARRGGGNLPAREARARARCAEHDRPLAHERVIGPDPHLVGTAVEAGLRELGKHDGETGGPGEVAPAVLRAAEEVVVLEAPDEQTGAGAGAELILDRPGELEQHPLGQHHRLQVGPLRPQSGEERVGLDRLLGLGPSDRRRQREALAAEAQHGADLLDVVLAVAAVAALTPVGLGEAVAALPHPQRSGRDAGALGQLGRGQLARGLRGTGGGGHRRRRHRTCCRENCNTLLH